MSKSYKGKLFILKRSFYSNDYKKISTDDKHIMLCVDVNKDEIDKYNLLHSYKFLGNGELVEFKLNDVNFSFYFEEFKI